jgi:hypothetical protein
MIATKIENIGHLSMVERGTLPANRVAFIEVSNAVLDPSVLTLSMPKRLIQELDLLPFGSRTERLSTGLTRCRVFGAARLTVQGRECTSDVVELPDDNPVLIGRIPLQLLDFVIDLAGQRLIGNPAHGGQQMFELYQISSTPDEYECHSD